MGWNGLERNKLDYILTDLLPVETSGLFSYYQFYKFLLKKDNQKILEEMIEQIKESRANNEAMFKNGWSTKPLKYRVLKGSTTKREMSIIQPLSVINLFLFIECYQKDILNYLKKHHEYSIRYYKKNTSLYYKSTSKRVIQYFQKSACRSARESIQQFGNYFKITPFESINSFAESRIWRISNFKYKYYAKLDYKACFDSIYTHAFTWAIERNVVDAKGATNSNLFIALDRVLQNINGKSSNGIVVGPEFSRMVAEVLLQHIDSEIYIALSKEGILYDNDYVAFRYVDDIFLFANQPNVLEKIIGEYKIIGEHYLLRLNELKIEQGNTPYLPKAWLGKTRQLSDKIANFFYQGKKNDFDNLPDEEKFLVKTEFFSIDRIKDEIAIIIKNYPDDKRTIVSFLLSTLLNNIGKKKDGYMLFSKKGSKKSLLLIDLALYIYAFFPSFEQTRKIISIISYMNSEISFKEDESNREKLSSLINRYAFVFRSGNLFDLCDWFPFLYEYKIQLDTITEAYLIKAAEECNNPIIWGNVLIYTQYYKSFSDEVCAKLEKIIEKQLLKISDTQEELQVEFWYILIFHNCPYISVALRDKMSQKINDMKQRISGKERDKPSKKATIIICEFLEQQSANGQKPKESFFNWSGSTNFGNQVTYRTYQRTFFKKYGKNKYGLYASLN